MINAAVNIEVEVEYSSNPNSTKNYQKLGILYTPNIFCIQNYTKIFNFLFIISYPPFLYLPLSHSLRLHRSLPSNNLHLIILQSIQLLMLQKLRRSKIDEHAIRFRKNQLVKSKRNFSRKTLSQSCWLPKNRFVRYDSKSEPCFRV